MFLQFWHLCNTQGRFFGLLMLCGYAEDSWELWVLILVFVFLRYVFFCVHPWCDFFVVQIFSFFWTVWLGKKSWCVNCCSIHWFSNLAIVTEADLRCGDFLSEKSCRHKLKVSTGFWSWPLNVSSVLTT